MFVEVLLAEQAVAAERETLVGSEEHDRVGEPALLLEREEYTADPVIHPLDERVVVGQFLRDHILRERPWQESFVADRKRAVVERMLGQEVLRGRRLTAVVPAAKLLQRLPGVVRRSERAPGKKRLVTEALDERLGRGADDLR